MSRSRSLLTFVALLILVIGNCHSISYVENVDIENELKVIGGGSVQIGQALFVASLRSLTNVFFCGGAIVSTNYVLTSASCTAGRAVNSINVMVGSHALLTPGAVHRSSSIITYPGFDPKTLQNDISLVRTATVIVVTPFVQIIPISQSVAINSHSVIVYGWGMYTPDAAYVVNHLQFLESATISNVNCTEQHTQNNAARINDNKVCTSPGQDRGICFGDQGSPLVRMIDIPFQPSQAQLVGIASWHSSCAEGYPDVYERVAPYYLWIMSYIN